jgi:hypothetical protein
MEPYQPEVKVENHPPGAEEAAENGLNLGRNDRKHPSVAKASLILWALYGG